MDQSARICRRRVPQLRGGEMSLTLYERVGQDGRRPSPFSWRIRYALTHKGADVEYIPMRFADVDTVRALSGQHMVPVLVDAGRVIHDSWNIAIHLEERFPERPSLFGGATGRGTTRLLNHWCDGTLGALVRRLIYTDFIFCLDEGDRAYFRRSREQALGMTLEQACADRPTWLSRFRDVLPPLERTLEEQTFIGGGTPAYADYVVFSIFQWARLGSPREILIGDSAVRAWRDRMIGLFDNLADRFPSYPERRTGTDGAPSAPPG
jgi:glutathione S-transferase